jgi:hypothetical protein
MNVLLYFRKKFSIMENTKRYAALYWVLFLLSVVAFFVLYRVIGGVCILVLPFATTFLAKALDIM